MNKKVLIVDDNETNRGLIVNIVKVLGVDFEEAVNGIEALEMVKKSQPNLILLDMLMPEIDGFEVARRLKKNSATSHIPILAVTAKAMIGDREKALTSGCDDYITKPIDTITVMNKIKNLLVREP